MDRFSKRVCAARGALTGGAQRRVCRLALAATLGLGTARCSLILDVPPAVDESHGSDTGGSDAGSMAAGGQAAAGSQTRDGGRPPPTGGGNPSTADGSSAGEPSLDAGFGPDAGQTPGSCADPCDCDDDGYDSETCAGNDCDDQDAKVNPGQTAYFPQRSENPSVGFDYDCSDSIDKDPALDLSVACASLALGDCQQGQGFDGTPPACGETGAWIECEADTLRCNKVVADSARVMLCH